MKGKIIALVIAAITLVGPFQFGFINNSENSNMFNVIMFILTIAGFLASFVIATESKSANEH